MLIILLAVVGVNDSLYGVSPSLLMSSILKCFIWEEPTKPIFLMILFISAISFDISVTKCRICKRLALLAHYV